METDSRSRQQKSYRMMRMIYDLGMSALILGVAVVMFFAERFSLDQLINADPMFRYMFGGLCLLYGGFRLYRGLKRDY
ncbi:MAG: hypothetical protein GXC72_04425 [Chitinophagaceae bacterium]|nr:hypothetical protein [Chitinophagaceae bacterium]